MKKLWWERKGLCYGKNGNLMFAGRDLTELAKTIRTPVFFYSAERILDNIQKIRKALDSAELKYKLFYAMKANRFAPLLTYLKTTGLCGIDACSPNELLFARQCGFECNEISYTSTAVSESDLDVIAGHKDILINCDSLSSIEGLGKRCPGRKIGVRVNPSAGTGYNSNLCYSGEKISKFGIYREQFAQAQELACKYNLDICSIHFHVGCGYLNKNIHLWDKAVQSAIWFLDQLKTLESVNLGGGLGLPFVCDDTPLDLKAWAAVIRKYFGNRSVQIYAEPGAYIVQDSGLMLLQVNMAETKKNTAFIGVDGGFNLAMEPLFYGLPYEPVVCSFKGSKEDVFSEKNLRKVTIVGNISEAIDVWAEDINFPYVKPGDYIAFLNAGAYASVKNSDHCMRGRFAECLLF